jgi:preprotein translocase subunit YajC
MIDHMHPYAGPTYRDPSVRWPAWLSFVGGGLLTLSLFYFGVSRPASQEMSQMREQIHSLEKSIAMIAGHQGSVDETNHLLSLLGQQQAYASSARRTLTEIQKLQNDVIAQSVNVQSAMDAVSQLGSLKDLVVANSDDLSAAAEALDASEELQNRLVQAAPSAAEALQVSDDLLTLRGQLIEDAYLNQPAEEALDNLLSLRQSLDAAHEGSSIAKDRMNDMTMLKDMILEQTNDLSESIETLQITQDMTDRFQAASQSFDSIRTWMDQIVMMQPAFDKVRIAMQPMTDLAKLERMRPQQLREFAEWFLQQSKTRLASMPSKSSVADFESQSDRSTSDAAEIE